MEDGPDQRKPNETRQEWETRQKKNTERRAAYAPGGYMSTRNADGNERGGAASMFEKYGFF